MSRGSAMTMVGQLKLGSYSGSLPSATVAATSPNIDALLG